MTDHYFVALTNHQTWLTHQKQRAEENREVAAQKGDHEIEEFFQDQATNYLRALKNLESAVDSARIERHIEDLWEGNPPRYLWGLRDNWNQITISENAEAAWSQMMTQPELSDLVVVRSEYRNGEWSDWEEVDQLGDTFADSMRRYAAADPRPHTKNREAPPCNLNP